MPKQKIVIPGGSGQIGHILANHFQGQGHKVTVIARRALPSSWRTVEWDGRHLGPWTKEIDGADIVINLAGRSVDCRYTESNRREIMESRTLTTKLIGDAIARASQPPLLWLNSSTATIYRHALDRPMDENTGELGGSEPGAPSTWRFSIDVATSWEKAFFDAQTPRTRKVALRSAMTMSPDRGGVFDSATSGAIRVGWNQRLRRAVRLMDSRHGLSQRRRLPDRARGHTRSGEPCITEPPAESRVHARLAPGLGRSHRTSRVGVDARNRIVPPTH
jgi:NAD dependent epimerase/dehydratase family enzyme